MHYIDHFGEKSPDYLQYRPDYPPAMYQFLAGLASKHDLAWDCGTGNGQAASKMADYFKQVIGSDINQAQLDVAINKDNVKYFCWPAEKTELQDASVDLITVAQALHWFDLDLFYQEVKRVSKYNAIIAAWCYSLGSVNPDVDLFIKRLYTDILGSNYWPKQRGYIDDEYQTIPFPFKKIEPPRFILEKSMNFMQLIGYLNTWSAVKEFQQLNQENPINLVFSDLQMAWGEPEAEQVMSWPVHMLVGHVF